MKISHKQKLENREAQYQLQCEINLMEQDTYRKMGQDIVDQENSVNIAQVINSSRKGEQVQLADESLFEPDQPIKFVEPTENEMLRHSFVSNFSYA